jgi:hypothetical protein
VTTDEQSGAKMLVPLRERIVLARERILARLRYFDFCVWLLERRIWRRETKLWAGVFARDLGFIVKATVAVVRHHLKARPRYASAEWRAFRDTLQRDFDYRNGEHHPARPSVAPWRVGYPTIADEKPPVSLASLPVTALPWPRGTVLH